MKRTRTPRTDAGGTPEHGSAHDEGVVLRATSRGAGRPVEVRAPRPGPPLRVMSGNATVEMIGGKLMVTPNSAANGDDVTVVVEY